MKETKVKNNLTQLSDKDLIMKLDGFRRELFTLRLNTATAHVKDYSQFDKIRKNVARVLTYLRQRGIK